MKILAPVLVLLAWSVAVPGAAFAQTPPPVPLFEQALPDMPGKELTLVEVALPPGGASPAHRHNAHVVVYVLEGSIVMQVAGQPAQTLGVGQTFYEKPDDIHTVGRNASTTKPAKFLVFMVKAKGSPVSLPVHGDH